MQKIIVLVALMLMMGSEVSFAQTAAELLEKARAEARESEELRKALDSPDNNLRVAAFQAMISSEKPHYRAIAIEYGLASSESLFRGLTLAALIDSASTIVLNLAPDPDAAKEVQERTAKSIASDGSMLPILFLAKINEKGNNIVLFKTTAPGSYQGRSVVEGMEFRFTTPTYSGTLTLGEDGLLQGPVAHGPKRYIASVRLQ
jgi:hypothetical protein